jgi:hypothetical protein
MNKTKLARTFALAGFLISALFFLYWNLDSKFNFFHLPAQAGGLAGGSSQHALRAFLVKLNFVLCPPLVVTVLGMDLGTTANFLLWGPFAGTKYGSVFRSWFNRWLSVERVGAF